MPLEVSDLESSIDRLTEVQGGKIGKAETAGCLKGENWNFKLKRLKTLVGWHVWRMLGLSGDLWRRENSLEPGKSEKWFRQR